MALDRETKEREAHGNETDRRVQIGRKFWEQQNEIMRHQGLSGRVFVEAQYKNGVMTRLTTTPQIVEE